MHGRDLKSVSDDELLRRLSALLKDSRWIEADLVAHIGEVDARRLYAREAAPSMFAYCTEVLHLSEPEAALRIRVARASRKHAVVLTMLRDGRIHLSGVALLAPLLTPKNRDRLLKRATHKSKREIERLDKVTFTASAELHDKLERLQALTRSSVPDGDLGKVIELAVTRELERLEARRFGTTNKPRKTLAHNDIRSKTRHIPAAVRRAVQERDGGRCTYRDKKGRRCTKRHDLEFHHRDPFGRGGDHRPENLAQMCRTHNALLAEQDYGKEVMERFGRSASRVSESPSGYGTFTTWPPPTSPEARHPPG